MNDGLNDGFAHNAWANALLLDLCRPLTADQFQITVPGTFGSIIDTLWHLIAAEGGYYFRLSGKTVAWDRRASTPPPFAEIEAAADDLRVRWQAFLTVPFDAEVQIPIPWDDAQTVNVRSGVILMQALHHGNEHRSQVATALTTLGIAIPDWGLWNWAEVSGRATFAANQ